MGKVQTLEVDRSYRDVSRTFKERAPVCLNVTMRSVEHGGSSYSNVQYTFTPSVVIAERGTNLYLQERQEGSVLIPGKMPDGGFYSVIADATPLSGNRTKIEIYTASRAYDVVVTAITGWASGQNIGCPDMTKRAQ
jgi:hypothetical protein